MENEIISILNNLVLSRENDSQNITITENTNILDEVRLDSIEMIDFMLKLEEKYDVEFDFNQFDLLHFSSIINLSNAILNMKK